jgi:hypothetical protein
MGVFIPLLLLVRRRVKIAALGNYSRDALQGGGSPIANTRLDPQCGSK